MDVQKCRNLAFKVAEALDLQGFDTFENEEEVDLRIEATAAVLSAIIAGKITKGRHKPPSQVQQNVITAMIDAGTTEYHTSMSDCKEEAALHRLSGAMLACLRDAVRGELDADKLDQATKNGLAKLDALTLSAVAPANTPAQNRMAKETTARYYQAGVDLLKAAGAEVAQAKRSNEECDN